MSDELYIDIFRYLADDAHDDRALEFAEVVWDHYYAALQAGDVGVDPEDLGIDDSLLDLGLARYVRDPESAEVLIVYTGFDAEFDDYEEVEQ